MVSNACNQKKPRIEWCPCFEEKIIRVCSKYRSMKYAFGNNVEGGAVVEVRSWRHLIVQAFVVLSSFPKFAIVAN